MKVCVFGSSSKSTPQKYLDESFKLGQLIADNGFICVNGGGMFGVMGKNCTNYHIFWFVLYIIV